MFDKNILNFIKQIDNNIEVEFETDMQKYGLACEPTEEKIYIGLRSTPTEEKAFIDYVNELEPNFFNKYSINNYILSILHEIGHIMTHQEELEEDYNQSTELLYQLEQNKLITKEQQCYFYVRLSLEHLATQWAIDFVKLNLDFTRQHQNKIIKRLVA
jgi:hypothetical protein